MIFIRKPLNPAVQGRRVLPSHAAVSSVVCYVVDGSATTKPCSLAVFCLALQIPLGRGIQSPICVLFEQESSRTTANIPVSCMVRRGCLINEVGQIHGTGSSAYESSSRLPANAHPVTRSCGHVECLYVWPPWFYVDRVAALVPCASCRRAGVPATLDMPADGQGQEQDTSE